MLVNAGIPKQASYWSISLLALQIDTHARDVLAVVMDSGQEDLEAVGDNHCIWDGTWGPVAWEIYT